MVAEGRGFFAPEPDHGGRSARAALCLAPDTPWGQRKATLKVLQTSACQNNCNYCAFRAGRDIRRAHLAPDELARSFDLMYRAGLVESLFLSSGVIGTHRTMDEMLATTELVRQKYGFRGYIHLKLLPGAEDAHIERGGRAGRPRLGQPGGADARDAGRARAAEADGCAGGAAAARGGDHRVGAIRLAVARAAGAARADARPAPTMGHARIGMSTQFVVGPAGESDRELLSTAQMLYREVRLARAYYSAFTPGARHAAGGRAAHRSAARVPAVPGRLAAALLPLSADELPFDADGQLRTEIDPKAAWAGAHPERFPIEVNAAPLDELLRMPGIGPTSARAIVQARRQGKLREIGDLRKLGARADRAAPFVTLAGRRPPYQPPLPF